MLPRVYLIGAGPGDPGLLTLRGAELLARADVVLYDGLSNDALLEHAGTADKVCVGKHGQSRIWTQHEIIEEMLMHARAGRIVARLKGGDPAVFARTAEEVDALRAAEIPFEIVPGITAALAAGSFAGIPITHRQLASAVALVTGHEEPGKSESALDWEALAKFPGTLVIYMGVTTAPQWTRALLDSGKDPATPVALLRRCSHPDQQTIHCRLDQVCDHLTPAHRFRPPVIVIIGEVTTLAPAMSWFDRRPLFRQTVLVTRPIDQAGELAGHLRELGASVLTQPVITIAAPADESDVDDAIAHLNSFTTLIFASTNGVRYFFDRLFRLGHDVRKLAGLRIAAVGDKTREAIERYSIRCDIVPTDFDADALAAELAPSAAEHRFLIVRASRGRETLPQKLIESGGQVRQVVAYEHGDVAVADPVIAEMIRSGQVNWVTITSSQSARNLASLFGQDLRKCRLATLSPITSKTVRELGFEVAAEADPYTMHSLAQAIAIATLSTGVHDDPKAV